MRAYIYCSYTGSPVGFLIRGLEKTPDNQWREMGEEKIPKDIRGCFEHGIVNNALGNFSQKDCGTEESPRLVALLKDLKFQQPGSKDNFTWYINVAFETELEKVYKVWLAEASDCDPAQILASILQVNKEDDYGYTVLFDKLENLLKTSFAGCLAPEKVKEVSQSNCCLQFQKNLPASSQAEFMTKFFDPEFSRDFDLSPNEDGWVICEKKKPMAVNYNLIAIAIILMVIGLIMINIL